MTTWNEFVSLHVQVVENFSGKDVFPETIIEESEELYGVSIKYVGMAYEYVVSFQPLGRHMPHGAIRTHFVSWHSDNEPDKNTTDWLWDDEAMYAFCLRHDHVQQQFAQFIHAHNKDNDDFTIIVV